MERPSKLLKTLCNIFACKQSFKKGALDYINHAIKSRCGRFMSVIFSRQTIKKPPLRGLSRGGRLNERSEIILDVILLSERLENGFGFNTELAPVNFFGSRVII